ncbi:MAG TPA: hypothetical protein VGM08_01425 [Candidatus Saccharimonadales bacterium]|jgi:hypothetical protein
MKSLTIPGGLNPQTVKLLFTLTIALLALNALPFLEIPFILLQFFVATIADSVTGWAANSNFSDFTQVTWRAALVGTIVTVLTTVGLAAFLYHERAHIRSWVDGTSNRIYRSRAGTAVLVFSFVAVFVGFALFVIGGWAGTVVAVAGF